MKKKEHRNKKGYLNYKKTLLRNFFFRRDSGQVEKNNTSSAEVLDVGLTYIQMKIPVEKITPEFEQSIKAKIPHNILKAKIREAASEDLEAIKNIHNKAWLTSHSPYSPITLEGIKEIFEIPTVKVFIARLYGQDGGFIITDLEGKNNEIGIIAGLGILPRFQRKYLGTILGIHCWEYFEKQNVKELRCEVYIDNIASDLLLKGLGFEEYDRITYKTEDFGPNNKENQLI